MPVVISLLRAVNLGGKNKLPMEQLRALYRKLAFEDVQSHLQSGNVVFRARQRNLASISAAIEEGIYKEFGFRTPVILRTLPELQQTVARNPFAARSDVPGDRLLVTFFARDPGKEARLALARLQPGKEELHAIGRELFIYFPDGAGRSKLTAARLDKAAGCAGTARNWNTVLALGDIAAKLEAHK